MAAEDLKWLREAYQSGVTCRKCGSKHLQIVRRPGSKIKRCQDCKVTWPDEKDSEYLTSPQR